ncbi:hypothetical protein UFOVP29_57 [uncultured Caudovirales phage]|uniref:Uncharacterized protein n=1 Tax=uncultured Caudovirales phage TaxID=2100421 RepID=A0A6J5KKE5_9CAUD|nr:hypothetical protein UFOVP29_57 [uncultured Caudovirales phage]
MTWSIVCNNKKTLREITSWCRSNMGRSHGEISDWWVGHHTQIYQIPGLGTAEAHVTSVFIRNRKFAMLALLQWG